MNNKLHQELMACPKCGSELIHLRNKQEMVCRFDRLAFPVRDQIPVLIEEEARELAADEEIADS